MEGGNGVSVVLPHHVRSGVAQVARFHGRISYQLRDALKVKRLLRVRYARL